MARFDSGVLGYMKGRIGTIVARIRYGEVYIAPKARKYKIKSEKLKFAQNVFGRRQRLNTQLRKDIKIQAFWKAIDSSGKNDNTKLMKRNQPFVDYERLLPGCGFTPLSDDKIIVKNVVVEELDIKFEYKLERTNLKILEPPYDVFCVFILDRLFQYSNDGRIRQNVFSAETKFQTIETEPSGTFIPVTVRPETVIRQQKYVAEKAYIMVAAIKLNELKNKYEWSDTYLEELIDYMPDENQKKKWDGKILKNND
jgi:hypothetical protein